MPDRRNVLLIDPGGGDGGIRTAIAAADPVTDVVASDGLDAADTPSPGRFDCVVDASDHDDRGVAVLEGVRAEPGPTPPVVVVGRDADRSVVRAALNAGADRFVELASDDADPGDVARAVLAAVDDRHRRDWYERAVEDAERPYAVLDREYVFRVANDAYRDHYGLDGDVVGRTAAAVLGESTAGRLRPYLDRALDGDPVRARPGEVTDDGDGDFDVRCYPVYDGEVIGAAIAMQDVTDRQWAERRFETFFQNMPVAGFVLDDGGVTTEVNPTFCERTGYDREEVVGKPLDELPGILPDADREKTIERFEQLSEGEQLPPAEIEYRTDDGERRYAIVESVPLMRDGEFRKLVGISRDVTELKRRERELARQNERLERFANIVSHDLRNPLGVAAAEVELARMDGETADLDRIETSLDRMEQIIDDVLTMAREGGTVEETEPVSLATIAGECWEGVETADADLQVDGDAVFAADRSRLRELFENLYRNAVEHGVTGERDGVTVRVGPTGDGFFVADDGPGIPEAERERVFEEGYTTAEDGTGFGLNVVEEIADAHDWTVAVRESEAGGARFEVAGVELETS